MLFELLRVACLYQCVSGGHSGVVCAVYGEQEAVSMYQRFNPQRTTAKAALRCSALRFNQLYLVEDDGELAASVFTRR